MMCYTIAIDGWLATLQDEVACTANAHRVNSIGPIGLYQLCYCSVQSWLNYNFKLSCTTQSSLSLLESSHIVTRVVLTCSPCRTHSSLEHWVLVSLGYCSRYLQDSLCSIIRLRLLLEINVEKTHISKWHRGSGDQSQSSTGTAPFALIAPGSLVGFMKLV